MGLIREENDQIIDSKEEQKYEEEEKKENLPDDQIEEQSEQESSLPKNRPRRDIIGPKRKIINMYTPKSLQQ